MVKLLFELDDEILVLIADGTYLYCEKSLNNQLQRKTYSGQKKRHLIKPFIIITSDGYIVDVFGLYPATHRNRKNYITINRCACFIFKTIVFNNI
ncbi:MAG: transposase family protein [bacterium]